MRVRRWVIVWLLAGPLLLLLLVPAWALAQAPIPMPGTTAKLTTVSVSTDLTTSPLLLKISYEMREQGRRGGVMEEILGRHAREIEEEIAAGDMRLAQYLTEHKAPATDVMHWMYLASKCGRTGLLRYFRERGGNPATARSESSWPTLCLSRSVEEIKFLLAEGVDVNEANRHGDTPLTIFLFGDLHSNTAGPPPPTDVPTSVGLAMAEFILEHGADPDPEDRRGESPLEESLRLGKHYRLLLAHGADPNGRGKSGPPPVFQACDADTVKALRECGGDVTMTDAYGRTALFVPSSASKVDALLDAGCRLDHRARGGLTPLHGAMDTYLNDGIPRMIERGANVNARDDLQRTPLCFSLDKRLLGHGADINARDMYGQTPVHYYACRQGAFGIGVTDACSLATTVAAAPNMKPDVNAQDVHGRTPLHWLAWRGSVADAWKVTDEFFALGAKANIRDEFGHTALDYVRMNHDNRIETALIAHGGESGTTTTATLAKEEGFLDPFAAVNDFVRQHRDSLDFDWLTDKPGDTAVTTADVIDLNNDGCLDLLLPCEKSYSRSGLDWFVVMGMPNGRFRFPVPGGGSFRQEGCATVHGWGWIGTGRMPLGLGQAVFFFGTEAYRFDQYVIRTVNPDRPDDPPPKE